MNYLYTIFKLESSSKEFFTSVICFCTFGFSGIGMSFLSMFDMDPLLCCKFSMAMAWVFPILYGLFIGYRLVPSVELFSKRKLLLYQLTFQLNALLLFIIGLFLLFL